MAKRSPSIVLFPSAVSAQYRVGVSLARLVYLRDGKRCVYCQCKLTNVGARAATIDHVRPVSTFPKGTAREIVNAPSNLVAACSKCNSRGKQGSTLRGYAERLVLLGNPSKVVRAMVRRVRKAQQRALSEV